MQHLQPNTTLQGGKYRIERVLGQGGFGITYLAIQVSSNRQIAIKELFLNGVNERLGSAVHVSNSVNDTLFEKQKEKFKKEAKRIMSLDNEHIVQVYDLFEENNTVYYVMDYLKGESLASKMKREGHPLAESEVMDILPQLLDALSEIHKFQIWHLDIKPANIMLIDKNVVLIDFGASKQIAPGEMTSTNLYFTPGYAPAEQTGMLFNQFGPWTDLYAVGATIFNLLTGKSPLEFDIEEFKEDDLPESNLGLMYKMINWMMQPRRKERPQKAVDVKQKFYIDLVSIGVLSIAKDVLSKDIVKVIGTDIDFVKDLRATKEQINSIQRKIQEMFGVDIEGYPMTHDVICVCILQQLNLLFNVGSEDSVEADDDYAKELENLVKEQNLILEEQREDTIINNNLNKEKKSMTIEEMVELVNSDNKKGLETIREIANSGDALAQQFLGFLYGNGAGGDEHRADAIYYYRLAAEQGLASAQTVFGKCYLAGDGVQKDDKKAFEWFEKAAKQNDADGQFMLGWCYQQGWGTVINNSLAYLWYRKAAEQGCAKAQVNLGNCYENGIGIPKNENEAFTWYKKAASQDDADALLYVGYCYEEGIGVEKNTYEATKWFKKAAEKGHYLAQYFLGIKYKDGNGVEQNMHQAQDWLQKAASQGYERATNVLAELEQQTTTAKPEVSSANTSSNSGCMLIIIFVIIISSMLTSIIT
ncbi:MAG: protein kinase [Bacteroidaceae bacterium]|nr:protein kinase [Bacteroidaceae bacterium]